MDVVQSVWMKTKLKKRNKFFYKMPHCLKCNEYFNVGDYHDHPIKSPRRIISPFDEIEFVEPSSHQPFRRISPRRISPFNLEDDETSSSTSSSDDDIIPYKNRGRRVILFSDDDEKAPSPVRSRSPKRQVFCKECGKKFKDGRGMHNHMKSHENKQEKAQYHAVCNFCGKKFKDGRGMYVHMKSHKRPTRTPTLQNKYFM